MRTPAPALTAAMLMATATLHAQTAPADPNLVFFLLAEQSRTAFTVQGAGARAIGTGGAFIAVADDATAVSFNPAGLAQLLRPEFSFVGQSLSRRQDYQRFTSADTVLEDSSSSDKRAAPEFWSFAMPWKREGLNHVVQFSYQRIFDFGYKSDRRYQARVNGVNQGILQAVDQRGGMNLWSVAFGAELSPRILIGGSVNLWRGSWAFTSETERFTPAGALASDVYFRQNNAIKGFNWSLGTIWRSEFVNLGLVYRSGFNADYTFANSMTIEDYSGGQSQESALPAQTFRLQWPETLGAGIGIHLHPRWLVTADWTSIRWSKATIHSSGSPYDGLNFFDLQAATLTPDTVDFHAGTEWIAYVGDRVVVPVRAGAFKEPQPLVDRRTGEQRVYKGWTAGFGVKSGGITVDVAYKKSDSVRQVSRLQVSSAGSTIGEEDLDEQRVFVSLIWQPKPEAVRKALSWLFVGN